MNINDYPDKYTDVETNRFLEETLQNYLPNRILEIGSGATTALMSSYNPDSLFSISIDKSRIERAEEIIEENDLPLPYLILATKVTITLGCCNRVPLFRVDSDLFPDEERFDFLFMNGPKLPMSRAGILINLEPHLSNDCIIAINDFGHRSVKSSIDTWKQVLKKRRHPRRIIELEIIQTPRKVALLKIQ